MIKLILFSLFMISTAFAEDVSFESACSTIAKGEVDGRGCKCPNGNFVSAWVQDACKGAQKCDKVPKDFKGDMKLIDALVKQGQLRCEGPGYNPFQTHITTSSDCPPWINLLSDGVGYFVMNVAKKASGYSVEIMSGEDLHKPTYRTLTCSPYVPSTDSTGVKKAD